MRVAERCAEQAAHTPLIATTPGRGVGGGGVVCTEDVPVALVDLRQDSSDGLRVLRSEKEWGGGGEDNKKPPIGSLGGKVPAQTHQRPSSLPE